MGAMGPLADGQRYVVMVQIPGPKTPDDAKAVNDLVARLQQLGADVKISITGSKGAGGSPQPR